jgi:hypothetical protein
MSDELSFNLPGHEADQRSARTANPDGNVHLLTRVSGIHNLVTYLRLDHRCTRVENPGGSSNFCQNPWGSRLSGQNCQRVPFHPPLCASLLKLIQLTRQLSSFPLFRFSWSWAVWPPAIPAISAPLWLLARLSTFDVPSSRWPQR